MHLATLGTVTGTLSGDDISYGVDNAGNTNCVFTSASGSALTFDTAGTCRVQATVSRTGYNDWTSPLFSVEITGTDPVDITWAGYTDSNILTVGDAPAPIGSDVQSYGCDKSGVHVE